MKGNGNEERVATCQAQAAEHLKPVFSNRGNAPGKPATTSIFQVKVVTDVANAASEVVNAWRDPRRRAGDQALARNYPAPVAGEPVLDRRKQENALRALKPTRPGAKDARAGGVIHRVHNRFRGVKMDKQQRYRGEAFRREQQYLDAHPDVFGEINSSDPRKQLDAALSKLETAKDLQSARGRDAKGEKHRQQVLERDLRDHHMNPVAQFALGKLAGTPNIKALTPTASKFKGARLADSARAMAVAAVPHAALYTAAGFPADFTQQLTAAANAVQASIDVRRRKIADRKNAGSTIEEALQEARSSALMLSGLVGRTVRRGTPLHDEWSSVKRIVNIAVRANPGVVAPAANPGAVPPAANPNTHTAPAAQEDKAA